MLFIWKRKGLLVPLALFLGYIPVIALAGISMDMNIEQGSLLNKLIGFVMLLLMFLPALINYLFTKYFVKDEGIKIVTDEEGKQYKIDTYSKFFFIRNFTWTFIFLIFEIIVLIKSIVSSYTN
ncbi:MULTISPECIES: hypothetical protein [Bacillus]|uniref:hypothetical protein n=1 Tax=Bacillus TaxID=1386 RepID=UPI00033077BA|nr:MULTISPECIES: hypothetical protein [Bacillus cereus group]EOP55836.1 hypothetical protein IIW_00754 [Bacillus cereus VD136]EOP74333.1 hypothetical protein KOW_00085 [Bacillus cereus VDM006]EOQ11931.1 hypothetical protein KOY_00707 [Bacillus cereus VDM021]PEK59924.1 hypothetical protein CN590_24770 [Bacillus pseudomycoides]PEL17525.1 hypothetical protein CN608_26585 [Bacillus pseudomycoides]